MTGYRFDDQMRTTLRRMADRVVLVTIVVGAGVVLVFVGEWMDGRREFVKSCGCWNRKREDVDMIGILWFGELCLKQILLIYRGHAVRLMLLMVFP